MKTPALSAILAIFLLSATAQAAKVYLRGADNNGVSKASVDRLVADVAKLKASGERDITVVLNSDGGDLQAAYAGYLRLKDMGIETHTDDICASSCTILYASGTRRSAAGGAQFMFHPIHIELASGLSKTQRQETRAKMDEYIAQFSGLWLSTVQNVDPWLAHELERNHTLTTGSDTYYSASSLRRSGYVNY